MIFACTDPACRFMAEGESGEFPVCPRCGSLMLTVPEENLTGEQYSGAVGRTRRRETEVFSAFRKLQRPAMPVA